MSSREVRDAVGAAEQTLEARAEELRRIVNAPSEKEVAARELAQIEQQIAEQREAAGREAAEKELLAIARAVGSFGAQLERLVESLAENANARDVATANEIWETKVLSRLELAAVLVRAFPGIKTPAMPTIIGPGHRSLVHGLSIKAPSRLVALITVNMSAEEQEATWREAARGWLRKHGSEVPTEVLAAVPPESEPPTKPERLLDQLRRELHEERREYALGELAAATQEANALHDLENQMRRSKGKRMARA